MRYTRLDGTGRRDGGVTKKAKKSKKATRTAPARLVSLKKTPGGKKRTAEDAQPVASAAGGADVAATPEAPGTGLARISQLETERSNLMAQVAWARGVAQEQQKALEVERQRAEKLAADLETQRARVEQLKALSTLDRLLGRHKRI